MDWKKKLTSRKFWICVAALLGSIAASIAGLTTSNQVVAGIGIVAGILSAAIYAFCEAWVDAQAVSRDEEVAKANTVTSILQTLSGTHKNEEEVCEADK